jgi:hypothetical protein
MPPSASVPVTPTDWRVSSTVTEPDSTPGSTSFCTPSVILVWKSSLASE